MPAKPLRIPWEYCECGCHSCDVRIGGAYFAYYTDLHGRYWFSTRHHPLLTGVEVASMAKIHQLVRRALKAQKKQLVQQLSELEAL